MNETLDEPPRQRQVKCLIGAMNLGEKHRPPADLKSFSLSDPEHVDSEVTA
jgi:hypothetical protein